MTNINKVFKSEVAKLLEREFEVSETMKLLVLTNPSIYMSWGVEARINFENKALLLKVNGHHHQGWVLITLAWDDTYTVRIFDDIRTMKHHLKDVYFDELQARIDVLIERVDDYNF